MRFWRTEFFGRGGDYDPQRDGPQRIFNAPPIVMALIVIIAAAHFILLFASRFIADGVLLSMAVIPARYARYFGVEAAAPFGLAFPETFLSEAAPFIGHVFLHAGFAHLGFNLLWLLVFGTPVARRFGAVRPLFSFSGWVTASVFLLFFFAGGAAGALFYVALNPAEESLLVGASGAISALMGAAVRFAFLRLTPWGAADRALAPLLDRRVIAFTLVWVVLNLLVGFAVLPPLGGGALGDGGAPNVAWEAHIGGYFFGLLAFPLFDRLFGARTR